MEISISAVGEEIALDQFCRWLREDVDIARAATISRVGAAGAGHMGALETICMTVSNATGLASLAITYANWRKARKNPPTLTFTVSGPLTDELFGLYAAAAGRVATTRPPDAVAQLCRAMDATDREGESIAQALIDTVDGATRALEVTTAFWHADQGHHALRTLDRAAGSLPDSDVLALAAELRARGHDEAAYDLCLRRMVVRPGSVREIIGTLRDAGRPVDAKNLIKAVAGQAPAPVLLDLVTGWADADRERVLAAAVLRAPGEVADLLDTLRPTHPAIARQLMSLMTDTMPSQAEFLPILLSRVNPRARTELLAWTVSTTEGQTVVKGLSEAGLEHYADALLGETAASARRVHDIAAHLASLCDAGQSRAVRVLLRRALAGAGRKEVTELVAALRAQGHDPAVAAVAAWVRATTDGGEADVKYRLLRVGLKDFVVERRRRW